MFITVIRYYFCAGICGVDNGFTAGSFFKFFNFNIIKVPFKVVALVGGPLFIIMAGILIIALFLLQKSHSNLVIDDNDDIDMETEEITNDGE